MNVNVDSLKDCKTEEITASHFALQIALQTMKERCQLLQQRLSSVEEENLRLRIDSQKNSTNSSDHISTCERILLEEKITQLTRQKSQLIDRIGMVTKENSQLWARLSRLTEANQSLGNHLSKISDTLSKHPINEVLNDDDDNTILGSNDNETKKKEESLEEISLKIIDTIRKEKKVLEQQCEEMVELQTGAISVEDCGFALTTNGDVVTGVSVKEGADNEEDVMEDMRKLREKIKKDQQLLKSQQAGLQAAIISINTVLFDKKCYKCRGRLSVEEETNVHNGVDGRSNSSNIITLEELENQLEEVKEPPDVDLCVQNGVRLTGDMVNNTMALNVHAGLGNNDDNDRICPLCCRYFSLSVSFDDFHEHVLSHFSNEDAEPESVVNDFEVVR